MQWGSWRLGFAGWTTSKTHFPQTCRELNSFKRTFVVESFHTRLMVWSSTTWKGWSPQPKIQHNDEKCIFQFSQNYWWWNQARSTIQAGSLHSHHWGIPNWGVPFHLQHHQPCLYDCSCGAHLCFYTFDVHCLWLPCEKKTKVSKMHKDNPIIETIENT